MSLNLMLSSRVVTHNFVWMQCLPLGLKDPPNYKFCVSLLMLVYSLVESEAMSGFQTWRVCSRVLCSGSLDVCLGLLYVLGKCPSWVHTCSHVRCVFLVLFTHANKKKKKNDE